MARQPLENHTMMVLNDIRKVFFLMLAFVFVLPGSATNCLGAEAPSANDAVELQQIAILPFITGSSEGQKKKNQLDCQLRDLGAVGEYFFPRAEEIMTTLVQTELLKKFGEQILPLAKSIEASKQIPREPSDTLRHIALRFGQDLGVDHVLVGLVWRYQERVGSAMAASDAASVAFSVFLVNVASRELMWSGTFDKTQTSLSENLFDAPMFFKKGLKWLTVEELSSYGTEKIFKKLSLQ